MIDTNRMQPVEVTVQTVRGRCSSPQSRQINRSYAASLRKCMSDFLCTRWRHGKDAGIFSEYRSTSISGNCSVKIQVQSHRRSTQSPSGRTWPEAIRFFPFKIDNTIFMLIYSSPFQIFGQMLKFFVILTPYSMDWSMINRISGIAHVDRSCQFTLDISFCTLKSVIVSSGLYLQHADVCLTCLQIRCYFHCYHGNVKMPLNSLMPPRRDSTLVLFGLVLILVF